MPRSGRLTFRLTPVMRTCDFLSTLSSRQMIAAPREPCVTGPGSSSIFLRVLGVHVGIVGRDGGIIVFLADVAAERRVDLLELHFRVRRVDDPAQVQVECPFRNVTLDFRAALTRMLTPSYVPEVGGERCTDPFVWQLELLAIGHVQRYFVADQGRVSPNAHAVFEVVDARLEVDGLVLIEFQRLVGAGLQVIGLRPWEPDLK